MDMVDSLHRMPMFIKHGASEHVVTLSSGSPCVYAKLCGHNVSKWADILRHSSCKSIFAYRFGLVP